MKKFTFIALYIFTLLLILISCSNIPNENEVKNGSYLDQLSAKRYGVSESAGGIISTSKEFHMESESYQDKEVSQTILYDLNGQTYEMEYIGSQRGPLMHDDIHEYMYRFPGEKKAIRIWLSGDTGECVDRSIPPLYLSEDAVLITAEQRYDIAYSFLCEHVTAPEEYKMLYDSAYDDFTAFCFARFVGDIETYERVAVFVEKTGEISSYSLAHIDDMYGVSVIPNEIMDMAYEQLEFRAGSLCGGLGDGYTYTYETSIDRLVRLDDGSLALDCAVDINITYPDEGGVSVGAWFIIPITEPAQ